MIRFREGSAADRDAILALRRRAFPDEDLEKQKPAFWDWEYRGGRMFVAEEDERVVGHFGFLPRRFSIGGREVPALLGADAMIDPDVQRRGVFGALARQAVEGVRRDIPLVVAWQIRPAVLPGMLQAGWSIVLSAPVLLRPVPGSIPMTARRSSATACEIVDPSRFVESPVWRYEHRQGGSAHLYSRDSVLRGIRTHCLVTFAGSPDAVRRLIGEALTSARRRGCLLAASLVSRDHPHYATLRRCGFFPGPHRFRLLAQTFDPALSLDQRWALTWASTDHV